jgi:hypothetical protein
MNIIRRLRPSLARQVVLRAVWVALLTIGLGSCSGDDEDDDPDFFDDAEVVDLSLEDSTIEVNEATILAVEFSFDFSRVFDDDENVVIVVRLPEGIEFRDGTSEIDGIDGDEEVGAQIVRCSGSDETFLIFDMDRFDLDDASNPPGDADAVLTLTIEGSDEVASKPLMP